MQLCANCGHENAEGELFCKKCGVALGVVSLSTKKLGDDQDYTPLAGSMDMSDDYVVLLHMLGFSDPVVLRVDTELLLGRITQDPTIASLNLESFGAAEQGVSRRHARLLRKDNHLFIRDLGSTNHTFLNGEKLIAENDYTLRDGDEIQLGRLTMKIFFK